MLTSVFKQHLNIYSTLFLLKPRIFRYRLPIVLRFLPFSDLYVYTRQPFLGFFVLLKNERYLTNYTKNKHNSFYNRWSTIGRISQHASIYILHVRISSGDKCENYAKNNVYKSALRETLSQLSAGGVLTEQILSSDKSSERL
jgi:hypothetical protein